MGEREYLRRMAELSCDTCCITIESDGKTITHEPTCRISLLTKQAETAEQAHAQLKRTVEFMEKTYLEQHGGSWGKCKYQAQVETAESRLAEAEKALQAVAKKVRTLADGLWEAGLKELSSKMHALGAEIEVEARAALRPSGEEEEAK